MRVDSTDIGMNNAAQIAAAGIEAIRAALFMPMSVLSTRMG